MAAKEKIEIYPGHVAIGILILLLFVSFLIVRNFITAIISSYVLAFIIQPIYKQIKRRFPKPISGIISVVILVVVIVIPVFFIIQSLIDAANLIKGINFDQVPIVERNDIISFVGSLSSKILSSLPSLILTIFLTLFGTYYFLTNWDFINSRIYQLLPFSDKKEFAKDMSKTSRSIIYGLLFVGILEFLVAFIGFSISGVQFALIFAMLIGFLAFTLILDPFIVWGPVGIYYYFVQNDHGTGIGVLITGLLLSTDTFLRPKIIGSASKINPFIMLLGILGGVTVFGILGFIIGPMVLVTSLRLLKEKIELNNN